MRYAGETVTIRFEPVGHRTLSLDVVRADGLLAPADKGDKAAG